MQRRLFLVVPLAFGLAWTLAMGCSGGVTGSVSTGGTSATGDTSVPGLEVASQVTLVSANESGSPSLAKSLRGLKAEPTSGDYVTDEAEIFVYDRSMEALDQFSEIMCSIADTHYADMVNQGNYIALVNAEGCSKSANQSGEASDEALVDDVEYEKWIVNFEAYYVFNQPDAEITVSVPGFSATESDELDLDYWTVGGGIKYLFD